MPPRTLSGIVNLAALLESWILETRPFLEIDGYVQLQQRRLLFGGYHLERSDVPWLLKAQSQAEQFLYMGVYHLLYSLL
jgi:hypothetical protein